MIRHQSNVHMLVCEKNRVLVNFRTVALFLNIRTLINIYFNVRTFFTFTVISPEFDAVQVSKRENANNVETEQNTGSFLGLHCLH